MTLYTSRTTFCTLCINSTFTFSTREIIGLCTFKHIAVWTLGPSWTLDTYLLYFIYTCVYIFRLLLLVSARCSMQLPPNDIPLPRQTSSFHSLDSSTFGSPTVNPLGESSIDSTTPVASSRNTFRSRRITTAAPYALPSGSQPNQRSPENARQWSLFGQLMEIEELQSSIGSPISVHEHVGSSPGLSTQRRLSSSFHTQCSAEPASYDAPFPIHPITTEPDSLSSSAASLDVPSSPTQSYLPLRRLTFTNTHRNILKCAIAYFVASLFTFSPHLSRFISDLSSYGPNDPTTPSPSGHMVATMYDE